MLAPCGDGVGRDGLPIAANHSAYFWCGGRDFIGVAKVLIKGPIASGWIVNSDGGAGALPKTGGKFAGVHDHHRTIIRKDSSVAPILQKPRKVLDSAAIAAAGGCLDDSRQECSVDRAICRNPAAQTQPRVGVTPVW